MRIKRNKHINKGRQSKTRREIKERKSKNDRNIFEERMFVNE